LRKASKWIIEYSNGKVRFVTDAENKVTEYKYDTSGDRIAVIDARNNKSAAREYTQKPLIKHKM